jgi:threonine dehydratase
LTYIHAFADPLVIAGQGTLGLEIAEDVPDCDAVLVPVGGGGLIAGIGTAIKALKPAVRIIGAESAAAPTLHASLRAGHPLRIAPTPTLADGLAVAEAGALCLEIARRVVDEVVLVEEPAIATAVVRLLEQEKAVVEGAGAVPLAALLSGAVPVAGRTIVLVLAGGNIDLTVLGRVIDRGLAAAGRLTRVTINISERPGSLARLLTVIGEAGASVDEVFHDRHFGAQDVAQVTVTVVMETRDPAHAEAVKAALAKAGYQAR